MNSTMYIIINATGIILLLLMFSDFGSTNVKSNNVDDQLFRAMLYINMALLVTDTIMWIYDGKQYPGAGLIFRVDTVIYYILQPAMCFVWVIYSEYKLKGNIGKLLKRTPIYALPMIAVAVLSVISIYKPIFFFIDARNRYQRADYFYLSFILDFIYIVYIYSVMLRMLVKNRKSPKRDTIKFLYLYPILPVICAILQSLFYGISIIWMGSVISLLIIYFNLQNRLITTDVLTGLNNRRRFEMYIASKLSSPLKHPILFVLMIDIDKFRNINNKFGHAVGDEALKNVAEIIKVAVSRNDFIARVGGEEFIVIGERDNTELAFDTIKAIKDETVTFNKKSEAPYKLSMSIGYAFLKNGEKRTADEIIREADKRMYNEKNRVDAEVK